MPDQKHVEHVAVVGGGSAGFMAALAIKKKLPLVRVTMVRSPDIGIIGVGEGSTPAFTRFIHEFLGISLQEFFRATRPGLKLGTSFMWGPRPRFLFPLGPHMVLKLNELPRSVGYYLDYSDGEAGTPSAARMQANRPFAFNSAGSLQIGNDFAYHVENERFAAFLEVKARTIGVEIIDGNIENAEQDDAGITALKLSDGRVIPADLYVDCSGFRSLLLGTTLGVPRLNYNATLACDRAVVGGWGRPPGVPIVGYTLSETMDAGWCWQIEHPDRINRGYVYSSAFMTDDVAETEMRRKNPLISETRTIRFVSGRYERSWVKNVVAIGNASGFVEPLEATSLAVIASRCTLLVELLTDSHCMLSPPLAQLFNASTAEMWDSIRDFLALHYRFNTRLDTPFWKDRQENTDLAGAEPLVNYYQHVGPSPLLVAGFVGKSVVFDANSYLTILTGLRAPSHHGHHPTDTELAIWDRWCKSNANAAQNAATVEQCLAIISGGTQV